MIVQYGFQLHVFLGVSGTNDIHFHTTHTASIAHSNVLNTTVVTYFQIPTCICFAAIHFLHSLQV